MEFTSEEKSRVIEIAKWIHDNDKNSCIAANYGPDSPLGPNRRIIEDAASNDLPNLLEDVADYFTFEVIGMCGCGTPKEVIKTVRDYLSIINKWSIDCRSDDREIFNNAHTVRKQLFNEVFKVNDECDNSLLLFMAYVLDHLQFTNHGTSITGCWITELGKMCLDVYDMYINHIVESGEE